MVTASIPLYVRSLSEELRSRSDRVRQLIGDAHWFHDGNHKEELLAEVLIRHLPTRYSVSRGFLITPDTQPDCSREQDLLILDASNHPFLFKSAGLSITFSSSVAAALSVKTSVGKEEFMDAWKTLASIPEPPKHITRGCFFFNEKTAPVKIETMLGWIEEAVRDTRMVAVNYIATTGDLFVRLDAAHDVARIRPYEIPGASFGTFLACLLADLSRDNESTSDALLQAFETMECKLLAPTWELSLGEP
jgi:hypothetical protein